MENNIERKLGNIFYIMTNVKVFLGMLYLLTHWDLMSIMTFGLLKIVIMFFSL